MVFKVSKDFSFVNDYLKESFCLTLAIKFPSRSKLSPALLDLSILSQLMEFLHQHALFEAPVECNTKCKGCEVRGGEEHESDGECHGSWWREASLVI